VHGDIKPDNILVFIDNDGIPLAKVADLGSSIIGESEHDLCYPPRSDPWTAPEHHHRGVSIAAAKTMDIYSLSFTCLWLLLDDRHGATTGKEAIEILWQLKDLDGLTKRACDTVESLNVSMTKEEGMKQFFNLTLATDPKARVSDVRQLMKYLEPNKYVPNPIPSSPLFPLLTIAAKLQCRRIGLLALSERHIILISR
jgi:serine/threonine protein kinase